jgi:hypothetical protein
LIVEDLEHRQIRPWLPRVTPHDQAVVGTHQVVDHGRVVAQRIVCERIVSERVVVGYRIVLTAI